MWQVAAWKAPYIIVRIAGSTVAALHQVQSNTCGGSDSEGSKVEQLTAPSSARMLGLAAATWSCFENDKTVCTPPHLTSSSKPSTQHQRFTVKQRGGQGRVAMRPTTPPAPDSLSVPQRNVFTAVRSVGPGAAADIRSRIRPLHELQRHAVSAAEYQLLLDAIDSNARTCRNDESEPSNDPTYRFRVFVTSFSPASREELPHAIATLIHEEVFWRFKLDIVEDKSLEHELGSLRTKQRH